MNAPNIPDAARSILKSVITALANAGLITGADAEHLVAVLGLRDA